MIGRVLPGPPINGDAPVGRGHVPFSVVPNANEDNPTALSQVQRRAVSELLRVSPVADDLARRFQEAGFSLALVGGSVRDALLGRLGNDLDFTTDARPEDVLKIVRPWADSVWEVGIAFGTVGCQKRPTRSGSELPDRGHDVPLGGVRPDLAQARGVLRRLHRGRPRPP